MYLGQRPNVINCLQKLYIIILRCCLKYWRPNRCWAPNKVGPIAGVRSPGYPINRRYDVQDAHVWGVHRHNLFDCSVFTSRIPFQNFTKATYNFQRNAILNNYYKTYTGRVVCCPLVNHVEYAPRALLRLGKNRTVGERRTDGRTPDRYITLTARRGQRNNRQRRIYKIMWWPVRYKSGAAVRPGP